jgi:hypothetical protein
MSLFSKSGETSSPLGIKEVPLPKDSSRPASPFNVHPSNWTINPFELAMPKPVGNFASVEYVNHVLRRVNYAYDMASGSAS